MDGGTMWASCLRTSTRLVADYDVKRWGIEFHSEEELDDDMKDVCEELSLQTSGTRKKAAEVLLLRLKCIVFSFVHK